METERPEHSAGLRGDKLGVSRHPRHCLATICIACGHTAPLSCLSTRGRDRLGICAKVRTLGLSAVCPLSSSPQSSHHWRLWGAEGRMSLWHSELSITTCCSRYPLPPSLIPHHLSQSAPLRALFTHQPGWSLLTPALTLSCRTLCSPHSLNSPATAELGR